MRFLFAVRSLDGARPAWKSGLSVSLAAISSLCLLVACGGGGDETCSADDSQESDCVRSGLVDDEIRRWGAWADDIDGDGFIDRVNAWNDCGHGGTEEGHPGTLDCPEGTTEAESNGNTIICTVPDSPLPHVQSCDS